MKLSGFTFVRNAILLGYPYLESIQSLLKLCDEVVVAVGESEDDTLNQILQIKDPKLRVIPTKWNELMQDRGYTYAQQKMVAQFNCRYDWAFYLECDEIVHEKDMEHIKAQIAKYHEDSEVEALVFDYYHFYGTANQVAVSPRWYKRAPRIIRNTIRSYAPDGLFWVVMEQNKKGRYPKAALANCHIYHYGHVRKIAAMDNKNQKVERYWGKNPSKFTSYGSIDAQSIKPFRGEHPAIIAKWLATSSEQEFHINPNYKLSSRDVRHRVISYVGDLLGGIDWSKKHYKLIRK